MQGHCDQIEESGQAALMNHQVANQAAIGGKAAQLQLVSQSSGRFSLLSAAQARSRNHILQAIEKQEPDQGGRVNAMLREWQSPVNSYPSENVLRLAHLWESADKHISYRDACRC